MNETKNENGKPFIRERIVPKKNGKRIALTILGTVFLALLFGAVAGVTFFISQNVLGKNNAPVESAPPIFLRDDTEVEEDERQGTVEDILEPSGTEEPSEEPSETAEPTEPAPVTVTSLYGAVRDCIVRVIVKQPAGEDWFGAEIAQRRETFAVAVAETDEAVFLLVDVPDAGEGTTVEILDGSTAYDTVLSGRDRLTGLGIIRMPKDVVRRKIPVIELGNSVIASSGDRVFMIGTPFGHYVAMEEGRITYAGAVESAEDGYLQRYYTDMARSKGNAAMLLNESGKLVGWVSDYASGDMEVAVACGISPLKYVIEDLCLQQKTAYFGVYCRVMTSLESSESGLPTGVYVLETTENSPAYLGGIQSGDRIVRINEQSITNLRSLQTTMDQARPGDTAEIVISRVISGEEQQLTVSVTFTER